MAKVIPLFSSSDICAFALEAWDNPWLDLADPQDDGNILLH
ncbi:MAG: hypothetical protein V4532_13990 [Pseudomonadota bacterium]